MSCSPPQAVLLITWIPHIIRGTIEPLCSVSHLLQPVCYFSHWYTSLLPVDSSLTISYTGYFFSIDCLQHFPCFFCFPFSNTSQLQQTLHSWTVSTLPLLPCFRDFSWVLILTICWFLTLVSPLLTYLLFSFLCFLKTCHMLFFLYDISVPDLCSVPRCERLNAGSVLALLSS